jgi:uncharacterized MnhB-related membrane protein
VLPLIKVPVEDVITKLVIAAVLAHLDPYMLTAPDAALALVKIGLCLSIVA